MTVHSDSRRFTMHHPGSAFWSAVLATHPLDLGLKRRPTPCRAWFVASSPLSVLVRSVFEDSTRPYTYYHLLSAAHKFDQSWLFEPGIELTVQTCASQYCSFLMPLFVVHA